MSGNIKAIELLGPGLETRAGYHIEDGGDAVLLAIILGYIFRDPTLVEVIEAEELTDEDDVTITIDLITGMIKARGIND